MRFVAAAAVFLQHLLEAADPERFRPFLALGPGVFGVVLFFLISGYVIPLSIRGDFSLADFAARRLFRVFPAYLVVVAALILIAGLRVEPWSEVLASGGAAGVVANLFLLQDYTGHPALLGVSWTLSLEFVWYGGFAASVLLLGERSAVRLALIGSAGVVALSLLSLMAEVRLPLGRIGMINAALLGYVASLAHRGLLGRRAFVTALAAFLVSVLISQWVAFGVFSHPRIGASTGLVAWLGATSVFVACLRPSAEAATPLGSALARLGAASYSVYLVHGPITTLWLAGFGKTAMLFAVPALTAAASLVLYRAVELPGIAAGRRVAALVRPPLPAAGHR